MEPDMTNTHDDMTARWKPSDAQIAAADTILAADTNVDYVLSGHFLTGKEYGIWTTDIELVYADGVEAANDDSYRDAQLAVEAAAIRKAGKQPGTVGYTVHRRNGHWAVFEDILTPASILNHTR